MSDDRSEAAIQELRARLADPDPGARARAVGAVRQVDLDDLGLLDDVLALCRDTTPLPEADQPAAPADPFAAFFGKGEAARAKVTVADRARERLVFTGVIGKPDTVAALARALEAGPAPALVQAVVKLLAETRWTDRLGAVRALAPRLMAADAALYEVIVRVGENEHRAMLAAALKPWRSRAINELLNHGPSKAITEDAIAEAALAGALLDADPALAEPVAADALTLLVSWDSRHVRQVSRAFEDRFGWAVLVSALDDADAGPRCAAWLAQGRPAPKALVQKLDDVLRAKPDLPHFPVDAWVRYTGSGLEVVKAWRAAGRCRGELEGFVRAWAASGEHPDRAWAAAEILLEAGLHEGVAAELLAGLREGRGPERWSRALFERLAGARPALPGLVDALGALIQRDGTLTRQIVPALLGVAEPEALRPLAERVLALAESRPIVRKPARKGLIHEEREGVDTAALQPLVLALQDPSLVARLQDVLPFVRAE